MQFQKRLAQLAVLLTFIVIMVGAYTRLVDAGLGCPDWPGCYGQILAPQTSESIQKATELYPGAPYDFAKAQTEMFHRYLATSLGFLILLLAGFAIKHKLSKRQLNTNSKTDNTPFKLCLFLLLWVIMQGILGKWTVTMRLLPTVVMSHLLFGMTTFALLWWLNLRLSNVNKVKVSSNLVSFAWISLITLGMQIALGGWTSTNYAALICPSFPFCGLENVEYNLKDAFLVFGQVGLTPPDLLFDISSKITQHMAHRVGAVITFITLITFGVMLLKKVKDASIRRLVFALKGLLTLQIALGIANVIAKLPLSIAVLHNGIAALLLVCVLSICFKLQRETTL